MVLVPIMWCASDATRRRGLRGVSMCEDECAVFEYATRTTHAFWNDGVPTGIYVCGIDGDEVVSCSFMPAMSRDAVKVPRCSMVIETAVPLEVGSWVRMSYGGDLEVSDA